MAIGTLLTGYPTVRDSEITDEYCKRLMSDLKVWQPGAISDDEIDCVCRFVQYVLTKNNQPIPLFLK